MTSLTFVKSEDLWEFFTDIDGVSDKLAQCNLCSKEINYTSTSHNLKNHLKTVHKIQVELKRVGNKRTVTGKKVWDSYIDIDRVNKTAVCRFCHNLLSFKSTSSNLRLHLRRKHPEQSANLEEDSLCEYEEEVYLEPEYLDDDDSESEATSPVWSFFEKEKNGRARCVVCCVLINASVSELRHHLRRKHPKLLTELNETQDEQNEKEDEVYTEVLYIEEPSSKEESRKSTAGEHKKKTSLLKVKPTETLRARRRSSSDDEGYRRKRPARTETVTKTKRTSDDEEIESFGTYVVCLLKKLPRNVSMKVQRDIINLIMNANLNEEKEEKMPRIIFDGNNIRTCEDNSIIVVTNKEGDNVNQEASNDVASENPSIPGSSLQS